MKVVENIFVSAMVALPLMWATLFVFILAGVQPTGQAKFVAWAVTALGVFIWCERDRVKTSR